MTDGRHVLVRVVCPIRNSQLQLYQLHLQLYSCTAVHWVYYRRFFDSISSAHLGGARRTSWTPSFSLLAAKPAVLFYIPRSAMCAGGQGLPS